MHCKSTCRVKIHCENPVFRCPPFKMFPLRLLTTIFGAPEVICTRRLALDSCSAGELPMEFWTPTASVGGLQLKTNEACDRISWGSSSESDRLATISPPVLMQSHATSSANFGPKHREQSPIGSSQTWLFQTWSFTTITLFCALLRPCALFCGLDSLEVALFCVFLRTPAFRTTALGNCRHQASYLSPTSQLHSPQYPEMGTLNPEIWVGQ